MHHPLTARLLRAAVPTAVLAVVGTLVAPLGATAAPSDVAPATATGVTLGQDTAAPASSAEPLVTLGPPDAARTYIVQLEGDVVPARASQRKQASRRGVVRSEQKDLRTRMSRKLGHTPRVGRTFTAALNGFTVTLTGKQARQVAELPGVSAVTVETISTLTATSNGADWIRADALWPQPDAPAELGTKGEGLVIGVIDSGINPANPAFAASVALGDGGDGYQHVNPLGPGTYLGMCDPASATHVAGWGCNDKLIGAYRFTSPSPTFVTSSAPYDDTGHGSHTASTAAGNQVRATWPGTDLLPNTGTSIDPASGLTTTVSGVAPHANLISYDVCAVNTTGRNGCATGDVVAAWDQAISDGVDVINYSIGNTQPSASWADPIAQAQLNARRAGINVAVSAGNQGATTSDGVGTITAHGDVPWVTSVANTSHDLAAGPGSVTFTTASGAAPIAPMQAVMSTATLSTDSPTAPIVLARNVDTIPSGAGDGFCLPNSLPTAAVEGRIVLCERGSNARVAKGRVVADARGVGMILVNTTPTEDLVHDVHVLPTAHLGKADGDTLRTWLTSTQGQGGLARITGGTAARSAANADVLNRTSSRGPTRNTHTIGPSLAAPGTDVLAAGGTGNAVEWTVLTGTSMASPHVAGSMALLKNLHPNWSPAEIQSALMTTAVTSVKDSDGTAATWFEMGSGRVDLSRATRAGLLLDSATTAFDNTDPATGGDLRTVNTPQLVDHACLTSCSISRTLTGTATGEGTWTASVSSNDPALTLGVDHPTFEVVDGSRTELRVTATMNSPAPDTWRTGTLTLTPPPGSSAPTAHLPIAVVGLAPTATLNPTVATHRTTGTRGIGSVNLPFAVDDATFRITEPSRGASQERTVPVDTTPGLPYDNGSGPIDRVDVPAGTKALVVGIDRTTSPDLDLFVGTGTTPSQGTTRCAADSAAAVETCVVTEPAAGTWWVLTQNVATGEPAALTSSTTTLVGDTTAGHARVVPAGRVATGLSQPVNLQWDAPLLTPTDSGGSGGSGWSVVEVTGPASTRVLRAVRLTQYLPDVTVADVPATLAAGDTLTHTIDIDPDLTGESPVHAVAVTLPKGWTVQSSAPGTGRTVTTTGGVSTVRWRGTQAELASTAGGAASLTLTAKVGVPATEGARLTVVTTESVSGPALTSERVVRGTVSVSGAEVPVVVPPAVPPTAKPPAVRPKAKVTLKVVAPRRAKVGRTAGKVRVLVRAVRAKPRGKITLKVVGAGRRLARTVKVPASGRIALALGRYRKKGTVTVRIRYAGSATTKAATRTIRIRITR